jgi:hypothetical protein
LAGPLAQVTAKTMPEVMQTGTKSTFQRRAKC